MKCVIVFAYVVHHLSFSVNGFNLSLLISSDAVTVYLIHDEFVFRILFSLIVQLLNEIPYAIISISIIVKPTDYICRYMMILHKIFKYYRINPICSNAKVVDNRVFMFNSDMCYVYLYNC